MEPAPRGPDGREVGQTQLAHGSYTPDEAPHGERHPCHLVLSGKCQSYIKSHRADVVHVCRSGRAVNW